MADLSERLLILIDELADGNVSEFAKKTKIKQATLHNYTKGRPPNAESLYNICKYAGVNINWLLLGKGTPYVKNDTANQKPMNGLDAEHLALIEAFNDKDRAKRIDHLLIQIENIRPTALKDIEVYLHGIANGLRMAVGAEQYTGEERRVGERRQVDDPSKIPGGLDRRTGKDRRKTGS